MTDIKIFNHKMFGDIRTTTDEQGQPLFVGKDVAEALGYAKSRNALAAHVDEDDKKDALIQGPHGGTQKMPVINESCLYSLILSSKLPQAKAFKRWVTSEVLPQIRKTGRYIPPHDEAGGRWQLTERMQGRGLAEGLGLGLPLTKRHARNLGGDLTLDESYHEGCRLIIELPFTCIETCV